MYVEIPGYGMHKFNAAFSFGGPELVRQTLKYNFDVDVQHYAIVNFEGFAKIADVIAPDGIEVDIPYDMSHGIGMMLEPMGLAAGPVITGVLADRMGLAGAMQIVPLVSIPVIICLVIGLRKYPASLRRAKSLQPVA